MPVVVRQKLFSVRCIAGWRTQKTNWIGRVARPHRKKCSLSSRSLNCSPSECSAFHLTFLLHRITVFRLMFSWCHHCKTMHARLSPHSVFRLVDTESHNSQLKARADQANDKERKVKQLSEEVEFYKNRWPYYYYHYGYPYYHHRYPYYYRHSYYKDPLPHPYYHYDSHLCHDWLADK